MDEMTTREILWNIPLVLKNIMYGTLLISLVFFVLGFFQKYKFIMGSKNEKLLPSKLEWKEFFKALLFQGKIIRKQVVALFHACIFWGFFVLWIATDLVAIHFDTPFKVFQGTTYIVISFLADIAGVVVFVGTLYFLFRRFFQKPSYLDKGKASYSEMYMFSMIILLILGGFILEGMRLVGNQMPISEQNWSPVGWALALLIKSFNFSDQGLGGSYQVIWAIHMFMTMFFVGSLTYTKFIHMFFVPFSALITPKMRSAILNPMNFENEEAETFGLSKISDLTPKERFDLLSCVECGRCTEVCPAVNAKKSLDPKKIISKIRDFHLGEVGSVFKINKLNEKSLWEEEGVAGTADLFTANELDACTTCGACVEECPSNIEHITTIMDLKRYKALTKGDLPPAAATTINQIKNSGNPWGLPQENRFAWADGLNIPVIESGGPAYDYLYFVGCAGSYDPANQKVVKETLALLKEANVSFAVLGKKEKCTGDSVRRFGDEYTFLEIANENIEMLKSLSFKKIVTHCPHCLHTIGKEYKKLGGEFETIHHTELLYSLIKKGKIVPKNKVEQELTYHDPCYLGRHHGEYDAPREILNSVPGVKLKELEESKDKSRCCGMGGGNMWYEVEEGEHLSKKRLEDIAKLKTETVATSCSFCLINLQSSKKQVKETENTKFEDIASILHKSVF